MPVDWDFLLSASQNDGRSACSHLQDVLWQSGTSEQIFFGLGQRNGVWHCRDAAPHLKWENVGTHGAEISRNISLFLVTDPHATIADTRTTLLTNFNHSKLTITFNKA
jgi:hypothetical protein